MDNVLVIERVSKSFGRVQAVVEVSLKIERGSVTALIGPNGAGKTTLFNLISGLLRPDEGSIRFQQSQEGGHELSGLKPWEVARLGVGRLFQDVHIFRRMTVLDNVLAGFRRGSGEDLLRSVFARRRFKDELSREAGEARELLKFVGLADRDSSLGGELSHGQQKLLAVAMLLAADSELLLLDEPTAGLGADMIEKMRRLIKQLVGFGGGKTVVIIEHNLTVVNQIADWCGVMDRGELTYFGRGGVNEVFDDPARRGAYIGLRPPYKNQAPVPGGVARS